jgi:hypothetical protein
MKAFFGILFAFIVAGQSSLDCSALRSQSVRRIARVIAAQTRGLEAQLAAASSLVCLSKKKRGKLMSVLLSTENVSAANKPKKTRRKGVCRSVRRKFRKWIRRVAKRVASSVVARRCRSATRRCREALKTSLKDLKHLKRALKRLRDFRRALRVLRCRKRRSSSRRLARLRTGVSSRSRSGSSSSSRRIGDSSTSRRRRVYSARCRRSLRRFLIWVKRKADVHCNTAKCANGYFNLRKWRRQWRAVSRRCKGVSRGIRLSRPAVTSSSSTSGRASTENSSASVPIWAIVGMSVLGLLVLILLAVAIAQGMKLKRSVPRPSSLASQQGTA